MKKKVNTALLAGLIGLGFGALNAADVYWLPAISPLLSSLAVLIGLALLWLQAGAAIGTAARGTDTHEPLSLSVTMTSSSMLPSKCSTLRPLTRH